MRPLIKYVYRAQCPLKELVDKVKRSYAFWEVAFIDRHTATTGTDSYLVHGLAKI